MGGRNCHNSARATAAVKIGKLACHEGYGAADSCMDGAVPADVRMRAAVKAKTLLTKENFPRPHCLPAEALHAAALGAAVAPVLRCPTSFLMCHNRILPPDVSLAKRIFSCRISVRRAVEQPGSSPGS